MVVAMKENEVTEIYFGNNRYLMKNRYYVNEHEVGQQRGWKVELYDAKHSSDPIMEFFSWWYWNDDYGLSEQGENEEFFIANPQSTAVKELLNILIYGRRDSDRSTPDSILLSLYNKIYKSSGESWRIVRQLTNAIKLAQEKAGDWHSINSRYVP